MKTSLIIFALLMSFSSMANASIVTSEILSNTTQVDGRLSIVERHVAHTGQSMMRSYKVPADTDIDALLAANAIKANDSFVSQEINSFVDRAMNGEDIRNEPVYHVTKRIVLKAIIKKFLISDAQQALSILPLLKLLSDDQINADFSIKLTKIKRRILNLNSIQGIVDIDMSDVEEK